MLNRLSFLLATLSFFAANAGADGASAAAAKLAKEHATAHGAAYAVPTSENQVVYKLHTPRGGEFIVATLNGGMLRVTDETTGVTHAFIAKHHGASVVFHQFLIEQHPSGGGEVLTSLDHRLEASLSDKEGSTTTSLTEEGYFFETLGVETKGASFPTKPLLFPEAPPLKDVCCISCGTYTVCSCSVTACNTSCCSGSCCGGGGGPHVENKH